MTTVHFFTSGYKPHSEGIAYFQIIYLKSNPVIVQFHLILTKMVKKSFKKSPLGATFSTDARSFYLIFFKIYFIFIL